jgi:MFS family permease
MNVRSEIPPATAVRPRSDAVLLVLCGAIFLDSLDISMTGVALPAIRGALGMSAGSLQWIVSAYVLGYGGFLLLGGRVADLFGRRRVFVASLAVFLAASGLGAAATTGGLLIATRFIKGAAAAFTAPAALSLITTSFPAGPARNRALAFFTATGASGFSLGLVLSGALTEAGWRWVFVFPVPVAALTLAAATRVVPHDDPAGRGRGSVDVTGAASLTLGMLALVFALVDAPSAGWASPATLGSFAAAAILLAGFVVIERRTRQPLVRLGILRSRALVRANVGAMCLFGGWVGFMFVTPLYLHTLAWSPLATGLAIFPSGLVVVTMAARTSSLIARFGTTRLIAAGFAAHLAAYLLFLRIGLHSGYPAVILPTVLLGGLGFALAYAPLNVAATTGIDPGEQGLAGGLVTSSLQFGGALVLAIATAVSRTATAGTSPHALLDGYRAALVVSAAAALAGLACTLALRDRPASKA